jgi:5,10-methylenetetrahydrofolate reductase
MSPVVTPAAQWSHPLFEDAAGDIAVSFEFFPPRTEKMEQILWESVETLAPLAPRFVSVTYGAGGSTRERSHATVVRIARETNPEAGTHQADLDNLKRKIDAGASRAITQFFFTPDCFFRFRDAAAAAGIDTELVPGILPVSNVAQTRKFASLCGATIPSWLDRLFEGLDNLPAARQLVAATVAAELCGQLYARGVRHFHFYTLNRAELAYAICHLLGLRPKDDTSERRTAA